MRCYERCPPDLRLHRQPVLEPGPYPGDQGQSPASVIAKDASEEASFLLLCKMKKMCYNAENQPGGNAMTASRCIYIANVLEKAENGG